MIKTKQYLLSLEISSTLMQAEHSHPGITYELVMGLVRKADMSVNMNESILRLQVHTHPSIYLHEIVWGEIFRGYEYFNPKPRKPE